MEKMDKDTLIGVAMLLQLLDESLLKTGLYIDSGAIWSDGDILGYLGIENGSYQFSQERI